MDRKRRTARPFLFGFDYAVQRLDRIDHFLLLSGICSISIRAAIVSLRLESAESVVFFMFFKEVCARRDDFVY